MTAEECEQLIAEIRAKQQMHSCIEGGCTSCAYIWDIEKIIKRFANKPEDDEYSFIIQDDNTVVRLIADHHPDDKCEQVLLEFHEVSHAIDSFVRIFKIEELKHLSENINKMLQWLENIPEV